ncbi:hypothetical protein HK097_000956 [Rhizophlyctis rosea]|uniref:Uncharacterized protein n=1 Tax=Rhizophlyctis rosea TaxID=64517 RepID=A0AAD5X1N2_9FUNG|nr:hypothetical protein HK097_000956 [Rhizophlyctis rosea]
MPLLAIPTTPTVMIRQDLRTGKALTGADFDAVTGYTKWPEPMNHPPKFPVRGVMTMHPKTGYVFSMLRRLASVEWCEGLEISAFLFCEGLPILRALLVEGKMKWEDVAEHRFHVVEILSTETRKRGKWAAATFNGLVGYVIGLSGKERSVVGVNFTIVTLTHDDF